MYAYAREDLDWWTERLGRELRDGEFGENVTTAGLDVTGALIGEIWRMGERGCPGHRAADPVRHLPGVDRTSGHWVRGSPRPAGPALTCGC